jgi:ADP-ribose pyrophosphatase YjhB (NUDIX family)
MNKFSKLKPEGLVKKEEDDILFQNDYLKILNYEDYTVVSEKDGVICIPYLIETNQIIVREEYIPSYKYASGQEYHLALVGGGIEMGETPEEALLRELQEEGGIVLREDFKIEFDKPLFVAKHTSTRYFPCILTLTENDYHEIMIKGDGTKFEDMSKTGKIDVKYLNSLNSSDVITELMLEKLKRHLNL